MTSRPDGDEPDASSSSDSAPPSAPPALPLKPTPEKPAPAHVRRRTLLIVLAPIVSIATLMLGLQVGAGNAIRAANVFAAPPGAPATAGAPVPFAWQVLTYVEDRGVRETVAMSDLTVILRSNGTEAEWFGASNADGIAEASFMLSSLPRTDTVEVEVRSASEAEPLARGLVEWKRDRTWAEADTLAAAAVRPSRRDGALGIDVIVEGQRLVVGFETPLWTHISAPDPSRVTLALAPEAGLRVDKEEPRIGCDGWAEVAAVAEGLVAGVQIEAKDVDGRRGNWFGALPVAAGAFFVNAPRVLPANEAKAIELVAPNPRNVVYAEVDDEHGRVFAAALAVETTADAPIPHARFAMPPLASGLHWIVVSGEPRGAEHLAGATFAKPILVGSAAGVRPNEACSVGPWLAKRPARGFPRWLGVDGMATRGAANRARHRLGLFIGLASLLSAAILEILLLTAASREARAAMLSADLEAPADHVLVTAKTPGGLVIALLVATLGFALLAALMVAKG